MFDRSAGETLADLNDQIVNCNGCERLVDFRSQVAQTKRRAYLKWDYWGKPVPSFGSDSARLLIVGLAPGAHGANRTGRIFTGDSSGDLLYATLHGCGFCNQPESTHKDDGLQLSDTYITAALHCVPPQNKPLRTELQTCQSYLTQELLLLKRIRVVVALGGIAWKGFLNSWRTAGKRLPAGHPRFSHGMEVRLNGKTHLIGSYHPSRQNTQTGRLTVEMFEGIFKRARQLLEPGKQALG